MVSEKTLKENIRQYWKYAEMAFENRDYNTALTMYYKCMASCADLKIYKETNKVPSNHSKRFRVLQNKFPKFYRPLDRNFSHYKDTYDLRVEKETVERIRQDARKLTKKTEVKAG